MRRSPSPPAPPRNALHARRDRRDPARLRRRRHRAGLHQRTAHARRDRRSPKEPTSALRYSRRRPFGPVQVVAGRTVELTVECDLAGRTAVRGARRHRSASNPTTRTRTGLIAEAVEAARAADVAVVVVGTNSRVESEGYDRTSLALPGRQDDLVRAVAAANPRTVVVVNSGSPVLLPWRDEVAAVLVELVRRPGVRQRDRRHPARSSPNPAAGCRPRGRRAGGRAGDRRHARPTGCCGTRRASTSAIGRGCEAEREPAYEFGHGLGYTTWNCATLGLGRRSTARSGSSSVDRRCRQHRPRRRKTGRAGLRRTRPDIAIDRPVRWLVGFAAVRPGQAKPSLSPSTSPHARSQTGTSGWKLRAGSVYIADRHVSRRPAARHHRDWR